MGKLVVTEFVSLDGVFEDPGWTFRFDRGGDGDRFKLDELLAADAELFGRITYEGFAAAWPSRSDDVGFADRINSLPKYVVSTTLTDVTWDNSFIVSGDLAKEVSAIKERYTGDVLVAGSGRLVNSLLAEDLVDQLNLMVFPVALGSGRTLFAGGFPATRFELVELGQTGADGVTVQKYRRIGRF